MKMSSFKINSHRLKSTDFALNPDFKAEGSVELKIDVNKTISKHAEKPMAEVTLKVSLFKDKPDAPFECTVVYQGLFSWEKDVPAEKVEQYLKCNAAALLYSYVRPLITQLTAMSNLPVLTLPFMNFIEDENEKEE